MTNTKTTAEITLLTVSKTLETLVTTGLSLIKTPRIVVVAVKIIDKIIIRYGAEHVHSTKAKYAIWNIVHKRSIKDMKYEDWKKLKQLKPKFAKY